MTKVVGLISGTSVDGIDGALVEITGTELDLRVDLIAGETYPYPEALKKQILAVCGGAALSMREFAELDEAIAGQFALAAQKIAAGLKVELLGSHGQTVFHRPPDQSPELGYSLQLGRGELIAHLTGATTVSNFRAADLAAKGQGAPLVSKVDACLLSDPHLSRSVQNLGGIGNLTYLPPRQDRDWQEKICGWDTGPGNVLIDLAVQQLTDGRQTYDQNGSWASRGTPCQALVQQWLEQDFLQQPPPKSTGRELYSQAYLQDCWQAAQKRQLKPADWLATLTEFTVASVVDSYRRFLPQMPAQVLLCGGGSRNQYLKNRLQCLLGSQSGVVTTDEVGLNSDFKEAIAFAVLAYWRSQGIAGNLPQVTGAKQPMLLGEIHSVIV